LGRKLSSPPPWGSGVREFLHSHTRGGDYSGGHSGGRSHHLQPPAPSGEAAFLPKAGGRYLGGARRRRLEQGDEIRPYETSMNEHSR